MEGKLAILGGGRMGEALMSGLLRSGWRRTDEVIVTVRREERAQLLTERHGVVTTMDNQSAIRESAIAIIAVKPQDMGALLEQIAPAVRPENLLISVAAGIPTAFIEKRIPVEVPVVRVMSNVPVLVDAMIDACILLGLSRDVATELIVQTMLGSAKLLRETKMHPVELRELVTSPGGTTISAIRELENAGVRAAFLNAISAAAERAHQLAGGEEE